MRALVQRVTEASVSVDGSVVGTIGAGLCAFVGVTATDNRAVAEKMASKLWHLRVLDDGTGTMNRSLADVDDPHVLVVSQFTLYGDTSRGRRPSWSGAASPEHAEPLVAAVAGELERLGAQVATGRFRASMRVALVNDGPVTLLLEL